MGLFSSIFGGKKTSQPNTALLEAEARRQAEAEAARYRELLEQQRQIAEQQRADAERRYQEQLAAQLAEAERQRTFEREQIERQATTQRDESARQEALQRELEATRQRERAETMAQQTARATAARDYATGRQRLMDDGRKKVDEAFAGFDDGYFQDFAKAFVGQYKPQAERGYEKARKQTTFALGDKGNLRSSAGAREFGDLRLELADNESKIAGAASDAAQSFRGDVERQRSDALGLVFSAGGVGSETLPDGVTDIGGMLEGLGSQIGGLTTTAQRRAQAIRAPSFASSAPNLSYSAPRAQRRAVA